MAGRRLSGGRPAQHRLAGKGRDQAAPHHRQLSQPAAATRASRSSMSRNGDRRTRRSPRGRRWPMNANARRSCWWRRTVRPALAQQRGAVPPPVATDAASTPEGSTMPDSAPITGTLMQGKRGLIMGVTNDRSLGWGIAAACAAQGAELAFTYQGEALGRRVRPLAASVGSDHAVPVRRRRRGQHRCRVRRVARALGRAGLPGPCHRLRRQGLSARPLPGYAARGVRAGAGHLLLFVHRGGAARRADDAARRQPADAELCRRRTLDAALQRDGRGEGGAGGVGALSGGGPGRPGHPGERDQRRPDPDAGVRRDWRFPLHPALEPVECADAAQRDDRAMSAAPACICCPICRPA